MLIENDFEVLARIEHVCASLLDIERIPPGGPGAELTQTMDERDDAGHRVGRAFRRAGGRW